jgi:hypothetical protein
MPSPAPAREPQNSHGGRPNGITTRQKLLTRSWIANVEAIETAVHGFKAGRPAVNGCQVVFFEMVRDRHLHVNVMHRRLTKGVRGWAGPASVRDGFVSNRTFSDASPKRIVRHIRDVVFAQGL